MNTLGGIVLLFAAAYVAYLCAIPFALARTIAQATTPIDLLNALVKARRYYGIQTVVSLYSTVLVVTTKALALVTGFSFESGLAGLAFGTLDQGIASTLGLAGMCFLFATLVEAFLFIRYDAFVRMFFVLRKWLGLDLELSSGGPTPGPNRSGPMIDC